MKFRLIAILVLALAVVSVFDGRSGDQVSEGWVKAGLAGGWTEGYSAAMTWPFDKQDIVIDGVKGFVVLNGQYGIGDFISFYNRDGSVWHSLTFYYDDFSGIYPYENDQFRPYAFHPDYFIFAVKLKAEHDDRFEVVVNEETGLTKFLRKGDGFYEFQTWSEHITNLFAVDFDPKRNPLRSRPAGDTIIYPTLEEKPTFHPVETSGEWLKVKWDSQRKGSPETEYDHGWIRWTRNGKLLIELWYLC
ncbi:MAG: hypothetical protein IPM63_09065 [Acidobacteriota bacterium]|nr:MAG: hypothetical protein IPM63_09065 [Acidobacteriota bacterium]